MFDSKLMSCWRYQQVNIFFKKIFIVLRAIILMGLIWLVFFEVSFSEKVFSGHVVLIDILLGLPLVVALLLVTDIIVMGILKTVACLFGFVQYHVHGEGDR